MTAARSFMACADFTPFAVSASMSAAALTIDMILDWLQGDVSPRYRTRYTEKWMGEKIEVKITLLLLNAIYVKLTDLVPYV